MGIILENQYPKGEPSGYILESITDAVAALDSQCQFVYLNEPWARILGSTIQEALGKNIWNLLPNHQETDFGKVYRQVAESNRPGEVEAYFASSDTWLDVHVYPAPTGVSILALDITARKRADPSARKSKERIDIALEAAKMGTWEWNLPTDEVYWNEQHFLLLGMEPRPGPLVPDDFLRHIHPEDRQRVEGELMRAIHEDAIYDTEFRIVRDDGPIRWVSGNGRISEEVDGRPTRVSGVMYDINDRKLTEEALRASQERLQIVLDSVTDHAIISTDTQTIITGWNLGAQNLFGFSEAEAIGQSIALIFTPEDREAGVLEAEMNTARHQGQAADERYHQRKDGSRFYVSGVLSRLGSSDNQLLGYVKVARDLSERQQMEQTLRDTNQRKNDFLAMLAHELRNPLAPIRNMLQVLTSQGDESVRSGVAMMSRQVDHLVRLIDDLLDVSRISRGKIDLRPEPIELTALVAQAVDTVRPLFEANGRSLHVALPTAPIYLQGDATRLTQVVTNLLTNGARYTREKGQVWLKLEKVGEEARLVVRDDGIGLAADQRTRIFEQFVQVDTALNRSRGGLGLGLSLVKNLVELHGGRAEASSEGLDQGSEFIVHLPISPGPDRVSTNLAHQQPTDARQTTDKQVLVVDDNRDAADTLMMLLKRKGYRDQTRYSGQEALEAAESLRPDVILLDISMPGLDGYETCRLLRRQPWTKDTVLIALTGYGQQKARQVSTEAGFDGHLVKPVDLKTLTELINSLAEAK